MNLSTSCNDVIATHSMIQHSSVQPNVKFYCADLWTGTLQLTVSKIINNHNHTGSMNGPTQWGSERTPYFNQVRHLDLMSLTTQKIKLALGVTEWVESVQHSRTMKRGRCVPHGISTRLVFLNYVRKKAYSHQPTYLTLRLISLTLNFTLIIFGLNFNQYKNISIKDMTAQWTHNIIKSYIAI